MVKLVMAICRLGQVWGRGAGLALALFGLGASPLGAQPCRDAGPDLVVDSNTANTTQSANLDRVLYFIDQGSYLSWSHDPYIRPTGEIFRKPDGSLLDGSTHHRVRIYYSPRVAEWLEAGRPTMQEWVAKKKDPNCYLPDGATIVKEMYKTEPPFYPEDDPVIGWAVMVRKNGASHDGWYWVIYFKEEFRSMDTMGTFSYSFCYTCHASTASQSTFASVKNLSGENAASIEQVAMISLVGPTFPAGTAGSGTSPTPHSNPRPGFEALYRTPSIYGPGQKVPEYGANITGPAFPDTDYDHVWNRKLPADKSYLTSDNCIGCHDATALVDTQVPNMLISRQITHDVTGKDETELLNLSVYGEWRASPMGMAGRDPVFFAQLESEMNTYPERAAEIQNTCLSCHGAMGQRQYAANTAKSDFKMATVFQTEGPNSHYGALARDGISCMICHQMDPKTVTAETNTGHFKRGEWDVIYGSTPPDSQPGGPIRPLPMQHALDFTPAYNSYINRSEACGVCHTIVLPVENPQQPVIGKAHEQDTFLEWYYSSYQNSNPAIPVVPAQAQTCQDCHMNATFQGNGKRVNFKVANIENTSWPNPLPENLAPAKDITVPPRPEVGRHTFFGMNLFVLSFYDQFRSLFGLLPDSNPPMGTLDNYRFAIEDGAWQIANQTAKLEIADMRSEGGNVEVGVKVTNFAGHRLPSGVGFRRAWLELAVLDADAKVLWASGRSDENGVLVGADGKTALVSEFTLDPEKLQPHWERISRQDQVQVYEERYTYRPTGPRPGQLNTSFFGINDVVKDNRLLPIGYHYDYVFKKAEEEVGDDAFESLLPDSKLPEVPGSLNPRRDPAYFNGTGTDLVTYQIPIAEISKAYQVRVRLHYQSLPPYYLRDRFASGALPGGTSEQVQRLYYLTGHTRLEGTPLAGWKIQVQEVVAPLRF